MKLVFSLMGSLYSANVDHFNDVPMDAIASQITSLTIVYSTVYSDADQRKHQSSTSLAFVRGIHRWPVNSPHKWPITRKMFPFDDVIMCTVAANSLYSHERIVLVLTYPPLDKMAAYSQTTFLNAFSWMKMFEFELKFHWSLFLWG